MGAKEFCAWCFSSSRTMGTDSLPRSLVSTAGCGARPHLRSTKWRGRPNSRVRGWCRDCLVSPSICVARECYRSQMLPIDISKIHRRWFLSALHGSGTGRDAGVMKKSRGCDPLWRRCTPGRRGRRGAPSKEPFNRPNKVKDGPLPPQVLVHLPFDIDEGRGGDGERGVLGEEGHRGVLPRALSSLEDERGVDLVAVDEVRLAIDELPGAEQRRCRVSAKRRLLGRIVGLLWPVLGGDEQVVPAGALDQRRDLKLAVMPRQLKRGLKSTTVRGRRSARWRARRWRSACLPAWRPWRRRACAIGRACGRGTRTGHARP